MLNETRDTIGTYFVLETVQLSLKTIERPLGPESSLISVADGSKTYAAIEKRASCMS